MATRVQTESAQRTSDCVTELLRKQPVNRRPKLTPYRRAILTP